MTNPPDFDESGNPIPRTPLYRGPTIGWVLVYENTLEPYGAAFSETRVAAINTFWDAQIHIIQMGGFTTVGDDGAGAFYTNAGATALGPMAFQDGNLQWWNLVIANGTTSLGYWNALGDDATDNTTTIQSIMDFGVEDVYVPSGTFRCGRITVPSTLKALHGPGAFRATGAFTAFTAWFRAAAPADGLVVDGVTFLAAAGTYDTNGMLNLINPFNAKVQNCTFNGGRFSVQLEASRHTTVLNNEMVGFNQSAIDANGANDTLFVLNNKITSAAVAGSSINVGDTLIESNDCLIAGNSVFGAAGFGIHVHTMARGKIVYNSVRETSAEAISVGGSSFSTLVANNHAYWTAAGTDTGMSCAGDDVAHKVEGIIFDGNVIQRSYLGGLVIGGFSQDCLIQNNRFIDVNRSNNAAAAPGAIFIIDESGTNQTLRNTVINNYATNIGGGHSKYIVAESGSPGLSPNYSYIASNYGRLMETGTVLLVGANSVETLNVVLP